MPLSLTVVAPNITPGVIPRTWGGISLTGVEIGCGLVIPVVSGRISFTVVEILVGCGETIVMTRGGMVIAASQIPRHARRRGSGGNLVYWPSTLRQSHVIFEYRGQPNYFF